MTRSRMPLLLAAALAAGGCLPMQLFDQDTQEASLATVPANPFGNPAPPATPQQTNFRPGDWQVAMRVDYIGRMMVASNRDTNLQPRFATLGVPHPEIFHQRTEIIFITEGLVKMCKSDGELAALLALELGKMVSEREALAGSQARSGDPRPPMDVPMGNAGQVTATDLTHVAELARFEQDRQRAGKRQRPPEPASLARTYLERAGHDPGQLDAVSGPLALAERNYTIEKQFKGSAISGMTRTQP